MTLHMGTHFNDVEQVLNDPTFQDRGGRRSPFVSTSRLVLEEDHVVSNGYTQQRPPSSNNYLGPIATEYRSVQTSRSYPNSTSGQDARPQKSPVSISSAPENTQMEYYSNTTTQGITTIPKGTCGACRSPVNGQVVIAAGHVWHPEHFTCAKCGDELGHRNFYERSGRIYCESDYFNLFFPRCAYCTGPIKEKCINAVDKQWHPEHFGCAACGKPFNEDGFHEKDGQAYCKKDYFALFAPKCRGCGKPVDSNFLTAWKNYWHRNCFMCTACRKPFDGGQFFELNGEPYCEMHYHEKRGSICSACRKPIVGRRVTAMKKNFHPEHFKCARCGLELNRSNFKEFSGQALCQSCYTREQQR